MSKFAKKLKKVQKKAEANVGTEQGGPEQPSVEKPVSAIKIKASAFVVDMASLMYYGSEKRTLKFEELDEGTQQLWADQASYALIALDKLDKMIVKKVLPEEQTNTRARHLERLTVIINEFNKGLKTTRPELYPSGELAHRILEGKLPGEG